MKKYIQKTKQQKQKNNGHNTNNCTSDTLTVSLDIRKIDCKYLENGLKNPDYFIYGAMIIAFETGCENRPLRNMEEYR